VEAANLTSIFFTPLLTPTHPNIIRLRPTRLDEDPREIPIRQAFSDMTEHRIPISRLRAESGLRDGPGPYISDLRGSAGHSLFTYAVEILKTQLETGQETVGNVPFDGSTGVTGALGIPT
jgi:hypothetical protein